MQSRYYIVNQVVINKFGKCVDRRILGPYITSEEALKVFNVFKRKTKGLSKPEGGCLETSVEIITSTGNETGESLETNYHYYDNK